MLTLFTSTRPFTDPHTILIQRNAIQSWIKSFPGCEIIIVGDEQGVAEISQEFGLTHISGVKKNERGIPYRSAVFRKACQAARTPLMCFISADIILMSDFLPAIQKVELLNFLLVGRRYDLDVTEAIDFNHPQWEAQLRERMQRAGLLHGPSAVDYAVFLRDIPAAMYPPFSMNHGGWDNWFIYQFKKAHLPVIDATPVIAVVHQNHDRKVQQARKKSLWRTNPQARAELKAAGGFSRMLTLRDADFLLTSQGLVRPSGTRRLYTILSQWSWWKALLGLKRYLQHMV